MAPARVAKCVALGCFAVATVAPATAPCGEGDGGACAAGDAFSTLQVAARSKAHVGLRIAELLHPHSPHFQALPYAAAKGAGSTSGDGAVCYQGANAGRLALLTLFASPAGRAWPASSQAYAQGLRANRVQYAAAHGYDYCEVTVASLSEGRPLAWGKVAAIQALLEQNRTVLWMDSDALVLKRDQDWEEVVRKALGKEPKSLVFSTDFQETLPTPSASHSTINAGVLLSPPTDWAKSFWASVWSDFPEAINDIWWEQRAILLYRDAHPEDFARHADIVPHRLINCNYGEGAGADCFIVHAGGGASDGKYDMLRKRFMGAGSECCSWSGAGPGPAA